MPDVWDTQRTTWMTPVAAARAGRSARNVIAVDPRSRGDARVGEPNHRPLTYRPELDGIRGLAILLVLVSHATPFHAAGWAGVAVFFVLSGYLITGVLQRDPRIGRFYLRRVARLAPALVVTLAFVWAFLPRNGIDAVILYAANWPIIAGYDMAALWHTWSLAIEEQFYLVWPFALPLLVKWPRALVGLAAAIVLLRFALPLEWAYYATFARLDGLLLGAALALLPLRPRASWPGLALLAACSLASPYTFPALSLAGMTLAGVLLVASPPKVLVALASVGRVSYSLYLYHLPLTFVFGPVGVLVAIPVAYLSTRFLEDPIRRRVAERLDRADGARHVTAGNARAGAWSVGP
jgi:peptidoglycan/LPS O-acetylase OafA/YrhL